MTQQLVSMGGPAVGLCTRAYHHCLSASIVCAEHREHTANIIGNPRNGLKWESRLDNAPESIRLLLWDQKPGSSIPWTE